MPNPNSRTEIGARLVLTRTALDYTQATMAGLMGVDGQTLAAYEAGRRRIPMKQALKLCPYGIPLDWIYQGQMANAHPRQDSRAGAPILERALGAWPDSHARRSSPLRPGAAPTAPAMARSASPGPRLGMTAGAQDGRDPVTPAGRAASRGASYERGRCSLRTKVRFPHSLFFDVERSCDPTRPTATATANEAPVGLMQCPYRPSKS